MYTEEDITSAVDAGVLSAEAAAALRAYVAHKGASARVDEEHFRLITSFNDVFVAIASALLLTAVAWLADSVDRWLSGVAVAATAWGLAEFFTRKRRMALPSILLLLAFVGGIFASGVLRFGDEPHEIAAAAILAAAGAWMHWRRFHVAITVAAGCGSLVALAFALFYTWMPRASDWTNAISFAAGLAVFYLALRWDTADPQRLTRKADVAFWLHLLDRRALLVSALLYVIWTLNALLERFGVVNQNAALTALVIGSALLMLSAFWNSARARLVRALPAAVSAKLPPLK
jgi:hypothetical protein